MGHDILSLALNVLGDHVSVITQMEFVVVHNLHSDTIKNKPPITSSNGKCEVYMITEGGGIWGGGTDPSQKSFSNFFA